MSMQADLIADRRKLRRRLTLWRVLAVLGVVIGVIGLGFAFGGRTVTAIGGEHVARVRLTGFISGDDRTLRLLREIRESHSVKGVVVHVDSPGGTVSGSEAIYLALRQLSQAKPTTAVVSGLAASGGYIAAIGTDRIVAQQTSLVGSIGVLFQMPNATKLLDTIGVNIEAIRSTPLKAAPSGFEPTSPEARAALERVVRDHYDWFRGLVRERRGLNEQQLAAVADGRVHTGRQSVELKLIDGLGGERQAIEWLENEKGVPKALPVRDWRRRSESDALGLWSGAARLANAAGLASLAGVLQRAGDLEPGMRLDGALALWQPVVEK